MRKRILVVMLAAALATSETLPVYAAWSPAEVQTESQLSAETASEELGGGNG